MPSFDLFKYTKSPLAFSEESLPEKLHHGQTQGLLGEEQRPDWEKYGRPQWKTITLRSCEIVVMFVCILMFVRGLRWQLNADQYCLEFQSFYCTNSRRIFSKKFQAALSEIISTCIEANRESLPLGAVQWLLNLAIAISRPPKPRGRRKMGQIRIEYVPSMRHSKILAFSS